MKTTNPVLKLVLGAACAVALSVASAGKSNFVSPEADGFRFLDQDAVRGAVSAKTDASLTVNDKVITTTLATTFTKDGKAITLKDIQVGDLVKVVTSKSGEDKLQAVSVAVIPKENKD